MSWRISVNAIKEEVTELTITDSFLPDKTMKLIPDTLRVVVGSGSGTSILTQGTDYVLTDNGVGGFAIEFIGNHKPLNRALYRVYFKTTFDVNEVLAGVGSLNSGLKYINKANFKGKTTDHLGKVKDLNKNAQADYSVTQNYFNQGQKTVSLSREGRTITWGVYTNMQGRDLTGSKFEITDKLTAGDQTVKEETIKVYKYSLDKTGNPVLGVLIDASNYVLVPDAAGKGFTITFDNGVYVPVYVTYETQINGLSEKTYSNVAAVTDKTGLKKEYPASVTYEFHDVFVDKSALNVSGKDVYTDDDLEWKVEINKSLSDIQNAVFEDTISSGLVLLKDTIKVYKNSVAEANLLKTITSDKIKVVKNENGTTKLTIELGHVKEKLFITYTTVITADKGTVSNSASLTGYGKKLGTTSKKEYTSQQTTWGSGSGKANRGSIEILKVDSGNNKIPLKGVKFELYYYLDDVGRVIGGPRETDQAGKLVYEGLPFRTYYLRETKALDGYQILTQPINLI